MFTHYEIKKQSHNLSYDAKEDNLFATLLNFAHKEVKFTTIQLLDSGYSDVRGFVEEIVGDVVPIRKISDDGEFDGKAIFSLNDITYMSCASQEESVVELLANLK